VYETEDDTQLNATISVARKLAEKLDGNDVRQYLAAAKAVLDNLLGESSQNLTPEALVQPLAFLMKAGALAGSPREVTHMRSLPSR